MRRGTVTAEEKIKRQLNGNVHIYRYYHCTKKKNPNCSQGSIEEKELQQQLNEALERIQIYPEFSAWAIEQLKLESGKEAESRNQILGNIQKDYSGVVKKIDNLIDMRAGGEITEDEFINKKTILIKEKDRLNQLLSDTDSRVDKWIEKAETIFQFAQTAKSKFDFGTYEDKRLVLSSLGSNFILKDQKVNIELNIPFSIICEVKKELDLIYSKLEPQEIGSDKINLGQLYSQSPILYRREESNLQPFP